MRRAVLAVLVLSLSGSVAGSAVAAADQPPPSEGSGGHECERTKGEPQTS